MKKELDTANKERLQKIEKILKQHIYNPKIQANKLGIPYITLYQILKNGSKISLFNALKIEKITGGRIKLTDLITVDEKQRLAEIDVIPLD